MGNNKLGETMITFFNSYMNLTISNFLDTINFETLGCHIDVEPEFTYYTQILYHIYCVLIISFTTFHLVLVRFKRPR